MTVTCKVTFDYDAEKEDELTLREGEIIENVTQHEGGWWEGDDPNGKRGWFPDNFVEVVKSKPKAKSEAKAPPPKPAPPAAAGKPKHPKAKCTFAYEAQNDDELSLELGDIITITKQEDEGWWDGELNGKSGVFPSNFVELIPEGEEPGSGDDEEPAIKPKKVHGVGLGNIFQGGKIELRKTGFGASKPPPPKKEEPAVPGPAALKPTPHSQPPPPEKKAAVPPAAKKKAKKPADTRPLVKVIFDYEKQNEDELELKVGQFVRVTKKEDEGWWEGDLDGVVGWFPDNFVEPATPEEIAEHEGGDEGEEEEEDKPETKRAALKPPPAKESPKPAGGPPPAAMKPPEGRTASIGRKAVPLPTKKEEPKDTPKDTPKAEPEPKAEEPAKPEASKPPPPTKASKPPPVAKSKPKPPPPAKSKPKPAAPEREDSKGEDISNAFARLKKTGPAAKESDRSPSVSENQKPAVKPPTTKPKDKDHDSNESSGKPAVAPHAHAPANGVDNEEVNKLKSELAEAKKEAAEALKAANSATAAAEKTSKDLEALEQTLAKLQKTVKVLISDLDEERANRAKMQVEVDRLKKLSEI